MLRLRREVVERHPLDSGFAVQVGQCAGPKCHHLLRTMPPSRFSTFAPTMRACKRPCNPSPASFLGVNNNNRWRVRWQHCQCTWRFGSSFGSRLGSLPFSGHLGQVHCRCSKSGCPSLQLRSFWTCPPMQLGSCVKGQVCTRPVSARLAALRVFRLNTSGRPLKVVPTFCVDEFTLQRVVVLERLCLPSVITEARSEARLGSAWETLVSQASL